MEIFLYQVLPIICVILLVALGLVWFPPMAWQVIHGVRGLLPLRKPRRREGEPHSFAVLICARNEAEVIGKLIDSIEAQEYPKDKYKIFCIADNCEDNTAQVARDCGCEVLERFDQTHKGKGYALEVLTAHINENYGETFDAYLVIDADNLIPPDFLKKMSGGLHAGLDVVSGWRTAKNPFDSVVSGCYDIFWSLVMRMYNAVRCSNGMSCMIYGTGFAVRREILRNGWGTSTMTEDGEFSCMARMKGYKIGVIQDARFYDEQPTKPRFFFSQFRRWEVGGVQCFRKLWKDACIRMKKNFVDGLDILCFLLVPYSEAALLFSAIPYAGLLILWGVPTKVLWLLLMAPLVAVLVLAALAAFGLAADGKPVFRMWRSILAFPIFILPTAFIAVSAIFLPKTEWKAIPHSSVKDMNNVDEIPPDPILEKVKQLKNK